PRDGGSDRFESRAGPIGPAKQRGREITKMPGAVPEPFAPLEPAAGEHDNAIANEGCACAHRQALLQRKVDRAFTQPVGKEFYGSHGSCSRCKPITTVACNRPCGAKFTTAPFS